MLIESYHIARNFGGGNVGEFGELIVDSPKFFLPMFYKSINYISHDPVDLTCGSFEHGCE